MSDEPPEQTAAGVTIRSSIRRGTGKRDEDTHVVEVEAPTLAGAIASHEGAVDYLEADVIERVRGLWRGGDGADD